MKSLLILGEHQNTSVNPNIQRLQRYSREIGISTKVRNYEELETKSLKIEDSNLAVMFFFPFSFWNKNCEIPEDTGIYGTSSRSYNQFNQFWKNTKKILEKKLPNKNLRYIIDPNFAALDRDKIATRDLLEKFGVSTTKKLPKDVCFLTETSKTKGIFIKSRYGALGKGITYLSPLGWFTNYKIGKNNTLSNHQSVKTKGKSGDPLETDWIFQEITGNKELLSKILNLEMIVEEEIVPPELEKGKKFDLRVYTVFGTVPYIFMRENEIKNIVTNFSQGGRIIHEVEKKLPEKALELAKKESLKAAKAFNSQFLGVDVIFDRNLETPRVLEVQTFTGFPKITKFNLSRYLAECIKKF